MTNRQRSMLIRAGIAGGGILLAMLARYLFGADDPMVQQATAVLGGGAVMSQVFRRAGDDPPLNE